MFRRLRLVILSAAILLVVALFVRLMQYCVIYNPVHFQLAKYNALIGGLNASIRLNKIIVDLPPKETSLSVTGKAYITGDNVFVPSWIGRKTILKSWLSDDSGCEGYLYVKHRIVYEEPAGDMNEIAITAPRFSGLYSLNQAHGAAKREMFVVEMLAPHWYALESPNQSLFD